MRRLPALLLLAPVVALASSPVSFTAWSSPASFAGGGSTAVMRLPLTTSGAGFDCTGAASCVSWDGSALVESAGLTWTQNGTVPQVAANALPTTASTGAAGPFSDANYYSYGTGSDPLDSTGDRFGCVAFVPSTADLAGGKVLAANGAFGVAGYWVEINASPTFVFRSNNPALVSAIPATLVVANGLNVGCFWRSATAISAKANLGATTTNAAAGTEVAGTAYVLKTGRAEPAGSFFNGQILAVVQGLGPCPTPPAPFAATCEGWATYQMKRQFGLIGPRGEEISITRATTATNEVNGAVWNVPAAVPRITTQGMLVERAITNVYPTPAAPASGTATATATGTHFFSVAGTGSQQVSFGTATGTGLPCTATQASPCQFSLTAAGTLTLGAVTGTLSCAQIEAGASRTSCTPAATRNADVVTVPWPVMPDINRWCVKATVKTDNWAPTGFPVLWNTGTSANSAELRAASSTALVFRVLDGAGALRAIQWTHGFTAGSTHTITACNANGALSVVVDGAPISAATTGAGTAVWASAPTSLSIGNGIAGVTANDGFSRSVTICKSGSAAQCR